MTSKFIYFCLTLTISGLQNFDVDISIILLCLKMFNPFTHSWDKILRDDKLSFVCPQNLRFLFKSFSSLIYSLIIFRMSTWSPNG